ncbi:MAG: Hsp70 family protein [Planctomycetota bacterium]
MAIGAAIRAACSPVSATTSSSWTSRRSPWASRPSAASPANHRELFDDPDQESMPPSTADDNQTQVSIHVLQGEREMAADNRTLGRFDLTGIPPARGLCRRSRSPASTRTASSTSRPRSAPASSPRTSRSSPLRASPRRRSERMKREAAENEVEDKKKREMVELRNKADMMVHETDRSLKEHGDKLSEDERNAIEAAKDKLQKDLEGGDHDTINRSTR